MTERNPADEGRIEGSILAGTGQDVRVLAAQGRDTRRFLDTLAKQTARRRNRQLAARLAELRTREEGTA
jgi:hypothetical protein